MPRPRPSTTRAPSRARSFRPSDARRRRGRVGAVTPVSRASAPSVRRDDRIQLCAIAFRFGGQLQPDDGATSGALRERPIEPGKVRRQDLVGALSPCAASRPAPSTHRPTPCPWPRPRSSKPRDGPRHLEPRAADDVPSEVVADEPTEIVDRRATRAAKPTTLNPPHATVGVRVDAQLAQLVAAKAGAPQRIGERRRIDGRAPFRLVAARGIRSRSRPRQTAQRRTSPATADAASSVPPQSRCRTPARWSVTHQHAAGGRACAARARRRRPDARPDSASASRDRTHRPDVDRGWRARTSARQSPAPRAPHVGRAAAVSPATTSAT